MSSFKPTTVSTLPAIIEPLSDSAKFWKNNLQPATIYKELSSINSIDLNADNEILTTSSARISLYGQSNLEIKRSFSSPNFTSLYCGTFRKDNSNIFAAGCGDGIIRVWDATKNKPLRELGSSEKTKTSKHSAAVHRIDFNGMNYLYSSSDDKSIKLWDITEDSVVNSIDGAHDDYIRASCFHPSTSSIVSGSYDHTVKVWDNRAPKACTFQYNHGSSVESVTCRDLLIISAGHTSIKIFDTVAGKVIRTIENAHHKTITNVYNYGCYLLTASIDGHLKVYDINFHVAASFSYVPSQLLSCCYNGSVLAVGTNDAILSVNKVAHNKAPKLARTFEFRDNASDEFLFDSIPVSKKSKLAVGDAFVVNSAKKNKYYLKHDELLRKFRHSSALSRVIRNYSKTEPEIVVSFLQELIRRSALRTALAGRNDKNLKKIIFFLIKNLSDPRFTRILVDVSLALVEVYTNQVNRSSEIQALFKNLNHCVSSEINCLTTMAEISGQLQILINSQIK